jgi:hypothetical protein
MIGLLSRQSIRAFRVESRVSRIAVAVVFARPEPRRYFTSTTVSSTIMASTQQVAPPNRKVGKKFVIACDGESLRISRFQTMMLTFLRNMDGIASSRSFTQMRR